MIDFILSHTNPFGCKSSLTLKSIFGRKNCQFFMFMPENFFCAELVIYRKLKKKETLMLSILKYFTKIAEIFSTAKSARSVQRVKNTISLSHTYYKSLARPMLLPISNSIIFSRAQNSSSVSRTQNLRREWLSIHPFKP